MLSSEMTVVQDTTPVSPVVDIVIPVYNEEKDLPRCIERLVDFISNSIPYSTRVTIADNASTDTTLVKGVELSERFPDRVRVVHLEKKGRGRALNAVWSFTDAEVAAYMDVDLSTDLNAALPLLASLISGHSDVAIGSRLQPHSRVVRGAKREFISRSYNMILRTAMRANFTDAQCGFKAIRTDIARSVLPFIFDTGWFFDTELLVISERIGLRISEVAVDWVDDPNSKVDIVSTAREDLKGCWRVARAVSKGDLPISELRASIGREPYVNGIPKGLIGQIVRFAMVGILSTVLNMVLFVIFRHSMGMQLANFISLAISAVFNVIANRAFTFGIRGKRQAGIHYAQALIVFAIIAVITGCSLVILKWADPHASRGMEVGVLIIANMIATIIRFFAYRLIFRVTHSRNDAEIHAKVSASENILSEESTATAG